MTQDPELVAGDPRWYNFLLGIFPLGLVFTGGSLARQPDNESPYKFVFATGGVRKKFREGMVGWVGVKMSKNGKFPVSKNIFSTMKNHLKCAKLTIFLHLTE